MKYYNICLNIIQKIDLMYIRLIKDFILLKISNNFNKNLFLEKEKN